MLDLIENPDVDVNDTDDDENYAHYANKNKVTEGYVMGTSVITLCGIEFVPHQDPLKLRVCPKCKELYNALFWRSE
jgi:hypothetical protein